MKFKTRIMSTAVAAAVGTFAGAAHAVNIGEDGVGQVLIYPYYTAQQKGSTAYDTYITVVNSDTVNGKAVKVRFLEGKNSVEVLDFNLYLSPNDVWTATVTRDASGNPRMRTTDNSCTAPEIPTATGGSSTAAGVERFANFVNFGYVGDLAKDDRLARGMEGYVEIIQMADIIPSGVGSTTDGAQGTPALNTFNASLHNSVGVPPNCAAIRNAWTSNDYGLPANDGVGAPTGGLSGAGALINPLEGTMQNYDAVAVNNFSTNTLHFLPGSIQPQLGDVNPKVSAVFSGTDVVLTNWGLAIAPSVMPVSALFLRNQVLNEYAIAAAPVGLGTDWVVNFPTKRLHLAMSAIADKLPFVSTVAGVGTPLTSTGACEVTTLSSYNREEGTVTTGLNFSPQPTAGVNSLCWEVNVISMVNGGVTSNILGSAASGGSTGGIRMTLNQPFTEGWMRMAFAQARTAPAASTTRTNIYTGVVTPGLAPVYTGLPVLGFAAFAFVNTGTLANYGGSQSHRYIRNIAP